MGTATDFAVERLARPTDATAGANTIAVVDGQRRVSFEELDRAAGQVANGLRTAGLGTGDRTVRSR
jgi:non-ribosomal peptide synthetase component E (peptide arylation enzyme)